MSTTAELELAEPPAAPEQRRRASDTPLHAGIDPLLAPTEIARWIAPQIAERIERAAWWPEHRLRENWKLGGLLHVRARLSPARVFTALTLADIERFLRSSQLVVAARERKDGPGFWAVRCDGDAVCRRLEADAED